MKEITAEGTPYIYFPRHGAGDGPDSTVSELDVQGIDPFMASILPTSTDTRMVLVRSPLSPKRAIAYYLYWNDGRNLDDVDQRVTNGAHTSDDFAHSVKAVHQVTVCANCGARWHTLVIPPGDPYLGAPGLLERKIAQSNFLLCPTCRAVLRQMVVKIFGAEGSYGNGTTHGDSPGRVG